jgi:hypothetical protein
MPTEHAVAANVGVDDGFDAVVLKLLAQVDDIVAGELAPAVGGDFAVARIQADDDVAAKRGAGVLQETGVFDRGGADDDVAQAGIQVTLDGVQITDTAAQLHIDSLPTDLRILRIAISFLGCRQTRRSGPPDAGAARPCRPSCGP